MTFDYRVSISYGARFTKEWTVDASRTAVAISRALDQHQRTYGPPATSSEPVRIEAVRIGKHQRGPCERTCRFRITAEGTATVNPYAGAYAPDTTQCANACTGLAGHRSLHVCAEHADL